MTDIPPDLFNLGYRDHNAYQMARDECRRWAESCRSVDVRGAIRIRFEAHLRGHHTRVAIEAVVSVPDRDNPTRVIELAFRYPAPNPRAADTHELRVGHLRRMAQEIYQHELDENFYAGGVRVHDPHKDEDTMKKGTRT